uniref:Uncharacterized protein n=1 Tax=Globisporangium ultimum (strain ATCC 200006 / CBS 805.95 / DAOM BR144) TaxID=431595 RepID=K3XBU5_GLOUD
MASFKHRVHKLYSEKYRRVKPPQTASDRRKDMFEHFIQSLSELSKETVINAFNKAGPFFPEGPSAV